MMPAVRDARRWAARATVPGLVLVLLALGASAADLDAVERGRHLFWSEGCYGCHTLGIAGTPIGPDLSRVGRWHSEQFLVRWLTDPQSQRPTAHMPALELQAAQAADLAAFLGSLR
jgi:cbb3-type cytochrome oxidase cytochrome c subunit